jgi:hypothetical protein
MQSVRNTSAISGARKKKAMRVSRRSYRMVEGLRAPVGSVMSKVMRRKEKGKRRHGCENDNLSVICGHTLDEAVQVV